MGIPSPFKVQQFNKDILAWLQEKDVKPEVATLSFIALLITLAKRQNISEAKLVESIKRTYPYVK